MTLSILPIACLLAVTAWAGASAPPGNDDTHKAAHSDAHTQHPAHSAAPLATTLHATDAPLRTGMLTIRNLYAAPRPTDAAAAKLLSDRIDAAVQQVFKQCQLETAADAALHGVLAQILEGSASLRADATDDQAWAKLHQALESYPQRFDDPAFAAPH